MNYVVKEAVDALNELHGSISYKDYCTIMDGLQEIETLRDRDEELEELWEKGISIPGHTPEWTADFLFRHFRGVVIDWIIRQGSYPLWPKLEGDYLLFRSFFQSTGCTSSPETVH